MEEKKIKKKKLTLSGSSTKLHNVSHYTGRRGKTSVVIEKKPARRWGEKKIQPRDSNFNKPQLTNNFPSKKPLIRKVRLSPAKKIPNRKSWKKTWGPPVLRVFLFESGL